MTEHSPVSLRDALVRVLTTPVTEGERADAALLDVHENYTVLVQRSWRPIGLLELNKTARTPESVRERLVRVFNRLGVGGLDLVILRCDELSEELLQVIDEMVQITPKVSVTYLDAEGRLVPREPGRPSKVLRAALDRLADPAVRAAMTPLRPGEVEEMKATFAREQRKADALLAAINRRPPQVTWVIGVSIAFLFALEGLWGGTENGLTLWRMGANDGALTAAEPWRLLSSAFLHRGLLHVALNLWVLSMFGAFLERLLGSARFLVLFGLSALGGSLASATLYGSAVSVGASGALFGVMAASFVLGMRRKGVPEKVANELSVNGWLPLLVNLAYSFRPGVDLWAHVGGAAVGALLVGSGLMRPAVPRVEDASEPIRAPGPGALGSSLVRKAAALVALAMIASVLLALATGRPWQLRFPPPATTVALPDIGLLVDVPPGLTLSAATDPRTGDRTVLIGDARRDPLLVEIRVAAPNRSVPPGADAEVLGMLQSAVLGHLASVGAADDAVRVEEVAGVSTVVVDAAVAQKHRVPRWLTLRGGRVVRVYAQLAPQAHPRWAAVAEGLILSLRETAD